MLPPLLSDLNAIMPATGLSSRNLHANDSPNLTSTSKTITTKNCTCSRDRCQQTILRLSRLLVKILNHGKTLWRITRHARAMCSTTRTTHQVWPTQIGRLERIRASAIARMETMQTLWVMTGQIASVLSQVWEINSFASIQRIPVKRRLFQALSWSVQLNTKTLTLTWWRSSSSSPREPLSLASSWPIRVRSYGTSCALTWRRFR